MNVCKLDNFAMQRARKVDFELNCAQYVALTAVELCVINAACMLSWSPVLPLPIFKDSANPSWQ